MCPADIRIVLKTNLIHESFSEAEVGNIKIDRLCAANARSFRHRRHSQTACVRQFSEEIFIRCLSSVLVRCFFLIVSKQQAYQKHQRSHFRSHVKESLKRYNTRIFRSDCTYHKW